MPVTIYNEDFLTCDTDREGLRDTSLIVTSPPYNIGVPYGTYDDNRPYDEYLKFTNKWIAKCYDILRPDGRLCMNIPIDSDKNGKHTQYADIVHIALQCGFKYKSTIVWNKKAMSGKRLFGSWLSQSAPNISTPYEMIVILYKECWRKLNRPAKPLELTKEEFLEWTNGIWTFSGETKKNSQHPAAFPIELPKRCIKLFSYAGETVLDPFVGTGNTLFACLELGRNGIGFEIDKTYYDTCIARINRYIKSGRIMPAVKQIASAML